MSLFNQSNSNHRTYDFRGDSSSKSSSLARGNACATCRGRKVRCDAAQPVCTPCLQSRRDCAYVPKKKLPGPASAATLGVKLAELEVKYHELSLTSGLGLATHHRGPSAPNGTSKSNGHHHVENDLSIGDRDAILDIFFHRQYNYGYFFPYARFKEELGNPDPAQRPHPALVLAMVLMGRSTLMYSPASRASNPCLVQLLNRIPPVDSLVARIQALLNESIANVDRLHDYFSASGILVQWFFSQGRLQEAQFLSASSARLIIGAKLHKINNEMLEGMSNELLRGDTRLPWDYTLMGRPSSLVDVGRRILTFWQSFYQDKLLGLVTGLPSAFEDSEEARITTVWPRCFTHYESGSAFRDGDFDSVDELLFGQDSHNSLEHTNRHRDSVFALGCQGITLLDRTARLAVSSQSDPTLTQPASAYHYILKLQTSLDNFSARIPSSPREFHHRKTIPQAEERTLENEYFWTFIRAIIQISRIQLYRTLEIRQSFVPRPNLHPSQFQQPFHTLRVEAAVQVSKAIQRLRSEQKVAPDGASKELDDPRMNPNNVTVGFFLTSAAVTLAEEITRLQIALSGRDDSSNRVSQLKAQLDTAEKNFQDARSLLEKMASGFPVLALQVDRLDSLRQGPSDAY